MESVGKLKKKLDAIYSKYIRVSHANDKGETSCVSCGHRAHWKQMQCGHFVSRTHSNLRYDERNTKPQCLRCNVWTGGNHARFAVYLKKLYGDDIIEVLAKESQVTKSFTPKELKNMIDVYKEMLKERLLLL